MAHRMSAAVVEEFGKPLVLCEWDRRDLPARVFVCLAQIRQRPQYTAHKKSIEICSASIIPTLKWDFAAHGAVSQYSFCSPLAGMEVGVPAIPA